MERITYQSTLTQMIQLTENIIKAVIVTVFHTLKKPSRDKMYFLKLQIRFIEVKNTMFQMKYTLDCINKN
jgi:hypothetical protein